MKIVAVTFRAFDKENKTFFIDKSFEQIHSELSDICETYIITSIFVSYDGHFEPLSHLTKFKK